MSRLRILGIILFCSIVLLGLIAGTTQLLKNRITYQLQVPPLENITMISIEQNKNSIKLERQEEWKDILEMLSGITRLSKEESIQDAPVNVTNVIKVDFYDTDQTQMTIYAYQKRNRYYLEQPYNGIYQISPDEYNTIEKYIR